MNTEGGTAQDQSRPFGRRPQDSPRLSRHLKTASAHLCHIGRAATFLLGRAATGPLPAALRDALVPATPTRCRSTATFPSRIATRTWTGPTRTSPPSPGTYWESALDPLAPAALRPARRTTLVPHAPGTPRRDGQRQAVAEDAQVLACRGRPGSAGWLTRRKHRSCSPPGPRPTSRPARPKILPNGPWLTRPRSAAAPGTGPLVLRAMAVRRCCPSATRAVGDGRSYTRPRP